MIIETAKSFFDFYFQWIIKLTTDLENEIKINVNIEILLTENGDIAVQNTNFTAWLSYPNSKS